MTIERVLLKCVCRYNVGVHMRWIASVSICRMLFEIEVSLHSLYTLGKIPACRYEFSLKDVSHSDGVRRTISQHSLK